MAFLTRANVCCLNRDVWTIYIMSNMQINNATTLIIVLSLWQDRSATCLNIFAIKSVLSVSIQTNLYYKPCQLFLLMNYVSICQETIYLYHTKEHFLVQHEILWICLSIQCHPYGIHYSKKKTLSFQQCLVKNDIGFLFSLSNDYEYIRPIYKETTESKFIAKYEKKIYQKPITAKQKCVPYLEAKLGFKTDRKILM